MVQHHLNLAKGHFVDNDNSTTSLISHNVIELDESIQKAKRLEKRGSFKRVSPELFVKIISYADSPSLMKFARVCKQFNQSILGEEELFRSFIMRGKSTQILRGLKYFKKRCNNSIHSVKLEVLDVESKGSLRSSLSRCKPTLRSLEVAHQGDIGCNLFNIAHGCPLLKVFSSSRLGSSNKSHLPASDSLTFATNLAIWKPQQLETFIFTCGSSNFQFDDVLLSILERAKVVKISNSGIPQDWIVNLLSSTPSLVEVELPFQQELSTEDEAIKMPDFNLPSLISLSLARIPLNSVCGSEQLFFKKLDAPSLQNLWIGYLEDPETLAQLKSHQIRNLRVGVQGRHPYLDSAEHSAFELVMAISSFDSLQSVNVQISGLESSQFCKEFLLLLTPKSSRAIQNGWKNKLLLPQLNSLTIGSNPEQGNKSQQVSVTVMDLASLVASRLAISRKVSCTDVVLSSNGDYRASEAPTSSTNATFPDSECQTCSLVECLDVQNTRVGRAPDHYSQMTPEASAWLSKTVSHFKPSAL